jgi:hypothetical protein
MKRISNLRLAGFLLATLFAAVAVSTIAGAQAQQTQQAQQSLGDYARALKKSQGPTPASAKVVYDNDNLPAGSLSVVGQKPDSSSNQGQDQDQQAADKGKDGLKPGQSPEDRDKALAALTAKLDEQKDKVNLLTRELDVLQGEYKLKATNFVNNPQQRVQNPNGFAVEGAKYQQQIADKQKDLDAAKATLAAMQSDARKAGAPNSVAHQ